MPNRLSARRGCSLVFLAISFASAPNCTSNASEKYTYTLLGSVVSRCDEWTSNREEERNDKIGGKIGVLANIQASLGYLSGTNQMAVAYGKKNILKGVDAEMVTDWLDQYCAKHPEQNLYAALDELYSRLEK